jgi:hypothetical protein
MVLPLAACTFQYTAAALFDDRHLMILLGSTLYGYTAESWINTIPSVVAS